VRVPEVAFQLIRYVNTGTVDLRYPDLAHNPVRRTWRVCGDDAVVLPEADLTSAKAIPDADTGD
jgi:hypothetical protein